MKSVIPRLLTGVLVVFAGAEISRIAINNYVASRCHVVYTVVYKNGVATCRSSVQVYGPAQSIKN
jgi:hypothetical protein